MELMMFPLAAAIAVLVVFLYLSRKRLSSDQEQRKRQMLQQMSSEMERLLPQRGTEVNLFKQQSILPEGSLLAKIPGVRPAMELVFKAGLSQHVSVFLLSILLVAFIAAYFMRHMGPIAFLLAPAIAIFIGYKYLQRRIFKRNDAFINQFPDAVDMIVRSVRSGHPLNTAMRMIADNMENPIRDEFKQVVDEVAYGRTLPEALQRMGQRVDEQDLHFFVVVLSVHQETGGSLAEVLTNLSTIIRKRKQLRLKIRALTSEGRATSYVLGALPVVEFIALYFLTPGYLDPLFTSLKGNILLGVAGGLIFGAIWIVRQMVNIDI